MTVGLPVAGGLLPPLPPHEVKPNTANNTAKTNPGILFDFSALVFVMIVTSYAIRFGLVSLLIQRVSCFAKRTKTGNMPLANIIQSSVPRKLALRLVLRAFACPAGAGSFCLNANLPNVLT